MMKDHSTMENWIAQTFGRALPAVPQTPAFQSPMTPSERKADQTTRVSREITDAAKERSQADVARLRQARLERDAEATASVPVKAPKKARASRTG